MNYRGQAKLYYLYMMSDGDVSDGEKKLFDKICKELYLDADDKKRIKQECAEISKNEGMTCIEVIEKNAEESYMYGTLDIDLDKYVSDDDKAKIIWNLVNLGYADTHFTIDEREVVDYLREYWEIPDNLYQEMIDVAETCLALEKHKLWIEGLPDTDYKLEKMKQVKKDLKHVQETILTTISEITF
ncbi:hypothetical protein [Blautia obeum]|uniref:tellurite resistance TerB family protein n=1 Tax=Blautia obeum TaxID=40520 RepID=UPI003D023385